MADVQVNNLDKSFGALKALDNVTLSFPDGEFFGLLGPSGSGKTTLLRTIAGFIFADRGTVRIGDISVENIPVEKREIGMVFQNYALFPNMSVADNVGFGLRVRKIPSAEEQKKVADALELVQLGGFADRRPHQLSGGQRQRVALARAIITQPRVLLLDEPLSALDKALRVDMQIELKRIQREIGITTIYVTHDQEEALTLSDRIGILKDGKLVQVGPPRDVYNRPGDEFTARFLGEANIFSGTARIDGFELANGPVLPWNANDQDRSGALVAAIRPENLTITTKAPKESDNAPSLKVTLRGKVFAGPTVTCLLDWHGQTIKLLAKAAELNDIPESGEVWISWANSNALILPAA